VKLFAPHRAAWIVVGLTRGVVGWLWYLWLEVA
jgi:hypothetical protein